MSEQPRLGAWVPVLCCMPWGPGLVVALAPMRPARAAAPGHLTSLSLDCPPVKQR